VKSLLGRPHTTGQEKNNLYGIKGTLCRPGDGKEEEEKIAVNWSQSPEEMGRWPGPRIQELAALSILHSSIVLLQPFLSLLFSQIVNFLFTLYKHFPGLAHPSIPEILFFPASSVT
jgi:hypothetical protein